MKNINLRDFIYGKNKKEIIFIKKKKKEKPSIRLYKKLFFIFFIFFIFLKISKKCYISKSKIPETLNFYFYEKNLIFPFVFLEKKIINNKVKSELKGFFIDLANEIAKSLGRKIKIIFLNNNLKNKKKFEKNNNLFFLEKEEISNFLNDIKFIKSNSIIGEKKIYCVSFKNLYLDSLNSLNDINLLILKNYLLKFFLEKKFINKTFTEIDNFENALIKLKDNKFDLLLMGEDDFKKNYKKIFNNKSIKLNIINFKNCKFKIINNNSNSYIIDLLNISIKELLKNGKISELKKKWNIY